MPTYYYNGVGVFVSPSPESTPRADKEYSAVSQQWTVNKLQITLENKLKNLIKSMPRVFAKDKSIDLYALDYAGQDMLSALSVGMLSALKQLQSKEITLSGVGEKTLKNGKTQNYYYSIAEDVDKKRDDNLVDDVKNFLRALEAMDKFFKTQGRRDINKKEWERVRSRFFLKRKGGGSRGSGQTLYAAMHDILYAEGGDTSANLATVFNAIRGDFGSNLGQMMEGIIVRMMSTDVVQENFAKEIGQAISKLHVEKTGSRAAEPGSIRASVDGITYSSDKNEVTGTIKGNNLRDGEITYTVGPNGGTITLGLSAKQYNFHSRKNESGAITLAELSISNFVDVFSNIKIDASDLSRQSSSYKGKNALYGYRLLGANHDVNSPVLMYLLAHRVGEVTFGSDIGGEFGKDTAELMVINGKLKNTADVLSEGTLRVSSTGIPNTRGEWWSESEALNKIDAIHKGKIKTELVFGRDKAIANFG